MALPIRTTVPDVEKLCAYLATKPTGASSAEARTVLDSTLLDGRKITAMKFWGLVEDDDGKMRLTELGRQLARDKGARKSIPLREVVKRVRPYAAIVERMVHRSETTISATEVAAHWHQHFAAEASGSDKILNDQAVCFFQVAEGADLGKIVVGRKGQPTRFEFDETIIRSFVDEVGAVGSGEAKIPPKPIATGDKDGTDDSRIDSLEARDEKRSKRVFITHGKNAKILNQIKEIVAFGKFEAVVAQERETAAKPVPEKVMDDMRSCGAGLIHIGSEGVLFDKDKNEVPQINGNVLIEIGAAMALYRRKFILLVEEGVKLPSNLQGLYECRYKGDELNMEATMKILKAFNEFM